MNAKGIELGTASTTLIKDIDDTKIKAINAIVDSSIQNFITGFEWRYSQEINKPTGVINMKKNNCFIANE